MKTYPHNWGSLFAILSVLYIINVKPNIIQSRIISGMPAAEGQFPWQVIIKEDEYDTLKCGGSIISDCWVLTAAHCTYGLPSVLLIFGTIKLENNDNNMTSNQLFIHPQYNYYNSVYDYNINNDISLIKLPTCLQFTSTVQPIALVSSLEDLNSFVDETAIISGFGLTDDVYLDPSPVLLWAQVKIVELFVCRYIYSKAQIDDTNICAQGDGESIMSSCSGDSGGPLIRILNGHAVQIGINLFIAKEDCTKGFPSGYVRLTSYLNYISNITGLSLC